MQISFSKMNTTQLLFMFLAAVFFTDHPTTAKKGITRIRVDSLENIFKGRLAARKKQIEDLADELVKGIRRTVSRPDREGNRFRKRSEIRNNGDRHIRLTQEFNGIKVWGSELITHVVPARQVRLKSKRTGRVTRTRRISARRDITGGFADKLKASLGRIDTAKLAQRRIAAMNRVINIQRRTFTRDINNRISIASRTQSSHLAEIRRRFRRASSSSKESSEPVIFVDAEGTPHTAYLVRYRIDEPPSYPHTIIDSDTGDVLKEWDGLPQYEAKRRQKRSISTIGKGPGGNRKIGRYNYGQGGKPLLEVDASGSSCKLESSKVRTVNYRQRTSADTSRGHSFTCPTQNSDQINDGYGPMNDAHYHATKFVDMFQSWYGKTPMKRSPIIIKAHYGNRMDNAYWDGEGLLLGDGNSFFYPLTSLDVIAHEISHGITEENSNLVYYEQSGALSEAFSDMAGRTAVRFANGYSSSFDWRIAAEITKTKGQLRCMDNPRCDGKSVDHISSYNTWSTSVHHGSGIFNKVFVLMAKSLPYNLWDAFDIMYVANTVYWQPLTDFRQAASLVLRTAEEMKDGKHLGWNYDYINMDTLKGHFRQVGINCRKTSSTWTCS